MPYCSICKKVVPDLDHHCEWCAAGVVHRGVTVVHRGVVYRGVVYRGVVRRVVHRVVHLVVRGGVVRRIVYRGVVRGGVVQGVCARRGACVSEVRAPACGGGVAGSARACVV